MFEFLRIQFRMGRISEEQLRSYVPRWITESQADAIVSENQGRAV